MSLSLSASPHAYQRALGKLKRQLGDILFYMPLLSNAVFDSSALRVSLSILAIAVTLLIYVLNRKRKVIAYGLVSRTPVLSVNKDFVGRVQILFDGKSTQDVYLYTINLENTGNEPVKTEDFVKPILFGFGDGSQVISADVVESSPKDLGARVELSSYGVQISPILMNPKDRMQLAVLVERGSELICSARVIGVSQVKRVSAITGTWIWWMGSLSLLSGVATAQIVSHSLSIAYKITSTVLIVAGLVISTITTVSRTSKR